MKPNQAGVLNKEDKANGKDWTNKKAFFWMGR